MTCRVISILLACSVLSTCWADEEDVPLLAQRMMVLSMDDYVGTSTYIDGSGRLTESAVLTALRARGADAVAGRSKSLANGLAEAANKSASVVVFPRLERMRSRRRSAEVQFQIKWYDLSRNVLSECSVRHEQEVAKGDRPTIRKLIDDAVVRCVEQVFEEAAVESAVGFGLASSEAVFGAQDGDLRLEATAGGVPVLTSQEQVAAALAAGDAVFLYRLYRHAGMISGRIEVYQANQPPLGVEAEVDPDISGVGRRMTQRLFDRALLALLDRMVTEGRSTPVRDELAIPPHDPLDRRIKLVGISLPRRLGSPKAAIDPAQLHWLKLTIDEAGEATEIASLAEPNAESEQKAGVATFLPGTRRGRPETVSCLVTFP